ncbi:MAG: dolichol-P-glucose synthetase [Ilumatobacteraceae bacterium]|nr:dolichol-P-glucose synthetase [Ilumatobacteraceae bacterium]
MTAVNTTVKGLGAPAEQVELTILMPCLNEAETLAVCIRQARNFLVTHDVRGEILIADNGSTDGSPQIAVDEGARVVRIGERGYGAALIGGIAAARGTYVAMADADDSYDFGTLGPFLDRLRAGDDLVMGNRFRGGIGPGAMPPLHRYLGNPVLSFVGRVFFRAPVRDFHCGLRAFRRDSIMALHLRTTGMEFASEMVVKSCLAELTISEVPTTLKKDGRSRPPHLRSFRDGWRHLRFLLLFSPRWLFLYPGVALTAIGVVFSAILINGPITVGGSGFDIGSLLYAIALTVVGYQAVLFAVLSKVYAQAEGFLPTKPRFDAFQRRLSMEKGVAIGVAILVFGLVASLLSLLRWSNAGFGSLSPSHSIRTVAPGVLGLMLGSQTILSGLFLSLLRVRILRADPLAAAEIAPQDPPLLPSTGPAPTDEVGAGPQQQVHAGEHP